MSSFRLVWRRFSPDSVIAATIPVACGLLLAEAYFRTSLGDSETSEQCRYSSTCDLITEQHVKKLQETGYVVIPNVLSKETLAQARKDVARVKSERRDDVVTGQVGSDTTSIQESIFGTSTKGGAASKPDRGDAVNWLRESDGTTPSLPFSPLGLGILHCIKLLRGVPYALESLEYSVYKHNLVPQQSQLANYPGDGDAGYPRHLDQCASSLTDLGLLEYWRLSDYRGRSITSILYLNDATWDGKLHCGQIRCYIASGVGGGKEGAAYEDIVPKGGTLLIFDSRRIEHEVLPSKRDRTALTSWASGTAVAAAAVG